MKRKIVLKETIVILMAIVLVFGNLSVVKAATKPWETAYTKILNNWKIVESYENAGTDYLKNYFGTDYKFNQYFLCDVDNNKVPELFLYSSTMGLTVVFTYKNGTLVCLGTDKFYKINTSKEVLILKGHWHGSGGSGDKEYSVYKVGENSLEQKYYIDYMDKYSVYKNDNWDNVQRTKKAYDEVYKNYIKGGKLFSKYKKYTLSDRKGLYGEKPSTVMSVVKGSYWQGTSSPSFAKYYIKISNCTSKGFDFEIYGRQKVDENFSTADANFSTVFNHHTAVYTSSKTATYNGQKYTLNFSWEKKGYLSVDGFPEWIPNSDILYNSDYIGVS